MSNPPNSPSIEIPFEQWLQKLEAIVRQLEEGKLGLGEALARYEEGITYLKQCHAGLNEAERRIELLTGVDAEGRPTVVPFDDEQLTNEAKAEARSRRRSKPAGTVRPEVISTEPPPDMDDHATGRLF